MKKYIKPTIKVKEMAVESDILAASGLTSNGDYSEQTQSADPSNPGTPIDQSGSIKSKRSLFDTDWGE